MRQTYLSKQLVLIGGGHANVQVLRKLCMNEYKGLNVVLISDEYHAIYSGMTPGYIKRLYSLEDISIDLQRLCFNAGATFIKDKVLRLDEENRIIYLRDNPSIFFDVLSINSGSISNIKNIQLENDLSIFPVKPISSFLSKLNLIDEIIENSTNKKIIIIGGGVAAYELSFSLYKRYQGKVSLSIISSQQLTERNLNTKTVNKLKKIAKNLNINLISKKALSINNSEIKLNNKEKIKSDLVLLSTGSSLPNWLENSNLEILGNSIVVNSQLQSLNYKNIFLSGDVASIENYNRTKSGVMAVRHGEILKDNIFLYFQNKALKKIKPQKNWLYLIGTNSNIAILNYYLFSFEARWCWVLKKIIDLKFIRKFSFPDKTNMNKNIYDLDLLNNDDTKMHCQGCGSKVSKNTLVNFLSNQKTNQELSDSTEIQFNQSNILQTIDHIKLFKSLNPYDFGIISYYHSQNDILSGGGVIHSLNVSIGIPFCKNSVEHFYLNYFMEGILSISKKENSKITSGHSYQTYEPGITLCVNGILKKKLSKKSAKEGDLIYLSKKIGVGYLLAAYFHNSPLIRSKEFSKIISYLKTSNFNAAKVALRYDSPVITDISGFGLASHLGDICKSSNLSAKINLNSEILINTNLKILDYFKSSSFEQNYISNNSIVDISDSHPIKNLIYDPQTNGPLIIVIQKQYKSDFERDFKIETNSKPLLLGQFTAKENYYIKII